jgi:hypothetical protein
VVEIARGTVADHPPFVDQVGHPFGKALGAQDAVAAADLLVEIAEEGKARQVDLLGEGASGMGRIDADGEDSGGKP